LVLYIIQHSTALDGTTGLNSSCRAAGTAQTGHKGQASAKFLVITSIVQNGDTSICSSKPSIGNQLHNCCDQQAPIRMAGTGTHSVPQHLKCSPHLCSLAQFSE
jgi:hypothetical protein